MTDKTKRDISKRVAVTVYMSEELAKQITQSYASVLLAGYKGTKQSYYTHLIAKALKAEEN